jgi:hypothetical protein
LISITNCEFGYQVSNGQSQDGLSHDIYTEAMNTTKTNCRHYGNSWGHNFKIRAPSASSSNNFYRCAQGNGPTPTVQNSSGRAFDVPQGSSTAITSSGDTLQIEASASFNFIAYADENTTSGTAGMTFTNTILSIGRYQTNIWNNQTVSAINFTNPTVTAFNTSGTPPSLVFQGPGSITGLSSTLPTASGAGLALPASTI